MIQCTQNLGNASSSLVTESSSGDPWGWGQEDTEGALEKLRKLGWFCGHHLDRGAGQGCTYVRTFKTVYFKRRRLRYISYNLTDLLKQQEELVKQRKKPVHSTYLQSLSLLSFRGPETRGAGLSVSTECWGPRVSNVHHP